ncbi:amidohydrolase family protein [Pukyongiella litopenaei]|uniref:Amidohydrolase family protein n=1 Tax=Pukyongiella litopenaei TaxID=2605946 RepID=A0A2S0MRL8_9RHOB|nr:amidohydrolase family protein [Pukyongiella litopenaei]AVO37542.1 amidohydrolase family protein [Pukyongiella litopenaei]AVO38524.1 amidohydrolase family protein [Pukyongiella litopenaei]
MSSLLIQNVRIMDGEAADILIRDGVVSRIAPGIEAPDVPVEPGGGLIAIPGLVDAHTHLDKSLLGWPWYKNDVGGASLTAMIENERNMKKSLGLDPHVQSMRHALKTAALGTTLIRSHVDIDTDAGLRAMEGVMETAARLADVVEIETVAFPQSGLMIREGTAELMDRALAMGADLVGGLDPCGVDRDPKGHLDTVFGLADKHGKGIDIHLHERGELGMFSMDMILDRAAALGMHGLVTISHAFCLGMPDFQRVEAMLERLAALDVRIMTTAPTSSPAPLVKQLDAHGIRIGAGNDGIQDTWGPYGNGDMLERAKFVGLRNNLRMDAEVKRALDICTGGGAEAMARPRRALETGAPGDVVLVAGETVAEAVVTHAPRKLVVKGGRVTARDGATLVAAP